MKSLKYNDFQGHEGLPLWVDGVGLREQMHGNIIRHAGLCEHLFVCFYDSVEVGIDNVSVKLPPGSTMFWKAGMPQTFGCEGKDWSYSWVRFHGPVSEKIMKDCRIEAGKSRPLSHCEVFERGIERLYSELCECPYQDKRIIEGVFDLMFRDISREIYCHASLDIPERLRNVKIILDTMPPVKVTLEGIAKTACLSQSHLTAEFRKYFGMPPVEYWNRNRMEYAAFLLRDETQQVSSIAELCGYPDVFQFSRAFKKYFGYSPTHARRLNFK